MKLNISNFRNIKDCSFDIIDNVLVLVGRNGVGKSNVLECIHENRESIYALKDYDDVVYIDAGASIDADISFESSSIFMQLINILYEGMDDASKFKSLQAEIEDILVENEDYKEFSKEATKDFFKCCSELASGIKRRLIYKLLYKIATTTTDKKLVILIDSPELYAHPSMIRMFCSELKFLSERGHLVIVSTHSAKVVETISTDIRQIAKLVIKDDSLESYQVDLEEYTKRLYSFYDTKNIFYLPNGKVNEALVHIVKNNLDSFCKSFLREGVLKILFADYILLGEGSSEEVLFSYIFTRMDYDLMQKYSKYNMDYVTGFGKFYLPFYFILANLYNVKVICVFDIDNLENKSHKAFFNAFSYYEINNKELFATVMLDPDLEHELEIEQSKHRVEKPLHIFNEVFYKKNNVDRIVEKIEKTLNVVL